MTSFTAPSYELLDDGVYEAEFRGIEERQKEDGVFYLWSFAVDYDGREIPVSGASSPKFGPKAKARAWAEAILGRAIQAVETVDVDALAGRPCQLILGTVDRDGTQFNQIVQVLKARRTGPARYDATGSPVA